MNRLLKPPCVLNTHIKTLQRPNHMLILETKTICFLFCNIFLSYLILGVIWGKVNKITKKITEVTLKITSVTILTRFCLNMT